VRPPPFPVGPKETDIVLLAPLTETYPEAGFGEDPPGEATTNGKVPSETAEKTTVEAVEDSVTPSSVTDQLAPIASPDSSKMTLNPARANVTEIVALIPGTETFPDDGVG
jgi:hypothetical protein